MGQTPYDGSSVLEYKLFQNETVFEDVDICWIFIL